MNKYLEFKQEAEAIKTAISKCLQAQSSNTAKPEQLMRSISRTHEAALALQRRAFDLMTNPFISGSQSAEIESLSNELFMEIAKLERATHM